jgi:hypothetical protein
MNAVSKRWFGRRGRLVTRNWNRATVLEKNRASGNNERGIKVTVAKGTLQENLNKLMTDMSTTLGRKRKAELTGLIPVGKLIKS